jgi:hypothetical protein
MRLRASVIALAALVLTDVPAHEPIRTLIRLGPMAVRLVSSRPPPAVALSRAAQARIDALVAGAIADQRIPGCVVVIGNKRGVLFRRA